MNAAELRRALERIAAQPADGLIAYGEEILDELSTPPTPAAVLVPVVLGPSPGILLTKRTAHLKKHAGQVSFPGGRIDPEDAHAEAAALREAREEIDLDTDRVEVLGRMADYVTGTGFRITPILGLLPPGMAYRPAPDEVEAVFELPIGTLLDPAAPRREFHPVRGRDREYWVWPHDRYFIWGATAAILKHLAEKLEEARGR
jgi:8-oxo-dGTP pyrophosphatase MutT (NUDIX family)